jgi:protein-S-isoprenylcysteine O-methyltransferase Ste14
MDLKRAVAMAVAYFTWITFAVCMRYYFRRSRKVNTAKCWLMRCGGLCSLAQMAVLALCPLPAPSLVWAGVVAYVAANALFWWALATHGKERPSFAFVPVVPPSFTDAGPYRLVRHPIYAAYMLAWLAGAVTCGQPWLLLMVGFMGAFYYGAARQEERLFLASPHGPQYRRYRRRTGMFLPKLFPGSSRRAA